LIDIAFREQTKRPRGVQLLDRARLNALEEEPAGSSRLPSSASADQPPPPSARTPSWVLFGDENLGLEILL
jgi:hypothetical protein